MEKSKISKFIQKYNLGGNVNSVKWEFDGKSVTTSFVTPDRNLLGTVKMGECEFEPSNIGVNDTTQLTKLLNILDGNLSLSLTKFKEKSISLNVKNGYISFDYPLADLSVIGDPPKLKTIPTFETKLKIDEKFIDVFIKGKNALQDVETFSVISNNSGVRTVIGYSTTNTSRVNIPTTVIENGMNDMVSFNANLFKDILVANKECTSAVFEISNEGLAKVEFNVDNYSSTYYLVASQGVN